MSWACERIRFESTRDGKVQTVVICHLAKEMDGHNHHYKRTSRVFDTSVKPDKRREKEFYFTAPPKCSDEELLECAQKRSALLDKFLTL